MPGVIGVTRGALLPEARLLLRQAAGVLRFR
jgi:hypothetical protein